MQFSVPKTLALLLAGAVCLLATVSNGAVVRDTTANLVPPDDDPGWSNVGIVRRSTGIYLGDRWMMTAAHVGAGEVKFPDERVFAHDPESIIRLANPTVPGRRLSEETDIILFQLVEDPELPGLDPQLPGLDPRPPGFDPGLPGLDPELPGLLGRQD